MSTYLGEKEDEMQEKYLSEWMEKHKNKKKNNLHRLFSIFKSVERGEENERDD